MSLSPRSQPKGTEPAPVIRLAIVEDDLQVRELLRQVFGTAPGFQVVGDYADGETAVRQLPANAPHVVLMDINLPRMSGIDCLSRLKGLLPGVKVIMVTVYDDNDTILRSLMAGADGYLLKRAERPRWLEMVREIVGGGAAISPQAARRIVEYFHRLKGEPQPNPAAGLPKELQSLTSREQEILAKLAGGLAPKEVAAELNIAWETVRNHITNIYAKLHVHSRSEAILAYLGRPRSSGS
jgi:DNA-binding NarL/FixJ family response regulator